MITEKKKFKKTFWFIMIMFGLIYFSSILTNNLSAQSLEQSANWKLFSKINGIQIYSKQIDC
ncbi:MAG: hypothetical protein K9J13_07480, partial [Saprospiraceae bacterium]|nr:hypothetical protein [Saprospiraceae bacterium]